MDAKWFAGRLKELRQQAGLTQQGLSDLAGLSKGGIADLEQGRREPTWASVVALSRALGVECSAFLQEPTASERPRRGRPGKRPPSGSAAETRRVQSERAREKPRLD
jgi:transcriptional regulator with XRE-family HTH domain